MSPPLDEVHVVARRPISVEEMTALASSAGWQLETRSMEKVYGGDPDVPAAAWRIGRRGLVKLVKSESLEHDYFAIRAVDAEEEVRRLTSTFPCYGLDEIVDRLCAATSAADRREALYLLAAARPSEFRHDVYEQIRRSLREPNSAIRVAAIICAARLSWSQLRPLLEKVRDDDESDNLQALSGNLLDLADWSRG